MKKKEPKPKICPHCGKVTRLAKPARDLNLLMHTLVYRVPVEQAITEAWVEKARRHCRMKPERLADLRRERQLDRFWEYMRDKRVRRRAWMKEHGEPPPYGWTPPRPGEPDRTNAVQAMKAYRESVAILKARYRRSPNAESTKILKRFVAAKKKRSGSRKLTALNDVSARLIMQFQIERGELTLGEYRELSTALIPDKAGHRSKKKGSSHSPAEKKADLCSRKKLP